MSENFETSKEDVKEAEVKTEVKQEPNKVVEVKAKDVNKKKEKVKKPSKIGRALKDTGNELKKVNWPKFGEVVKQTGVVLVVVLVFALVLFGFDWLCEKLAGLLF